MDQYHLSRITRTQVIKIDSRAAFSAFYIPDEQKIIVLGGVDQNGMKKFDAQTI